MAFAERERISQTANWMTAFTSYGLSTCTKRAHIDARCSLSQRILSEIYGLRYNAACPTMDAVVLSSDKDTKLSLWRVAGQAGKVWQADLDQPFEGLAWSPDGKLALCCLGRLDIEGRPFPCLCAAACPYRTRQNRAPLCAHWHSSSSRDSRLVPQEGLTKQQAAEAVAFMLAGTSRKFREASAATSSGTHQAFTCPAPSPKAGFVSLLWLVGTF
jgi:hypothetical protein